MAESPVQARDYLTPAVWDGARYVSPPPVALVDGHHDRCPMSRPDMYHDPRCICAELVDGA